MYFKYHSNDLVFGSSHQGNSSSLWSACLKCTCGSKLNSSPVTAFRKRTGGDFSSAAVFTLWRQRRDMLRRVSPLEAGSGISFVAFMRRSFLCRSSGLCRVSPLSSPSLCPVALKGVHSLFASLRCRLPTPLACSMVLVKKHCVLEHFTLSKMKY